MLPRRALMNDKIVSAQGENLFLVNVKGSKLNALSVYGKSMQSGTPTPENPVPIVSAGDEGEINVTVQGGNLVDESQMEQGFIGWANGSVTATDDIRYKSFAIDVEPGTYTLSTDTNILMVRLLVDGVLNVIGITITSDDSYTVTVTQSGLLGMSFRRSNSEAWDNPDLPIKIMLNAGSTPLPYMPYKTPQTLTAQTPGGLPGIPVSSGGNYTDESGQRWICDEFDFKNKKFIQRVERVSFDGAEDERWVRNITGENYQRFYIAFLNGNKNFMQCLCNRFIYASSAEIGEIGTCFVANSTFYIYVEASIDTVALLRDYLNTHPLDVIYPLGMPVEIDISDEEIQAFKELHTYSPTTTVSNDAGAWMKVGYREYRR